MKAWDDKNYFDKAKCVSYLWIVPLCGIGVPLMGFLLIICVSISLFLLGVTALPWLALAFHLAGANNPLPPVWMFIVSSVIIGLLVVVPAIWSARK